MSKGPGAGGFWLILGSRWLEGSGPRREVSNMAHELGLSRACSALWVLTLPEIEATAEH